MKLAVICALAGVLVVGETYVLSQAKTPKVRSNLAVGNMSVGDRLLWSTQSLRYPMNNTIQSENVVYTGNRTTIVTAIRATEQGVSQRASAAIIAGGVGARNVSVRLTSAVGRGYNFLVQFWGR